jgi:hypothetical protein
MQTLTTSPYLATTKRGHCGPAACGPCRPASGHARLCIHTPRWVDRGSTRYAQSGKLVRRRGEARAPTPRPPHSEGVMPVGAAVARRGGSSHWRTTVPHRGGTTLLTVINSEIRPSITIKNREIWQINMTYAFISNLVPHVFEKLYFL